MGRQPTPCGKQAARSLWPVEGWLFTAARARTWPSDRWAALSFL